MLVIATRNPGKLREIELLLADLPWQIWSLDSFGEIRAARETADSYRENAIGKAE
ncbi:MAG: non-canonical purine NTP pyrophosphatase, partial [Pyrinomonadaceae bacterium]